MQSAQELKKLNCINIKRFFISILFFFNIEIYAEEHSCYQSLKEVPKAINSNGGKSSEQIREGNYLVNYLRDKYPKALSAEQEKELIIKYQTTDALKVSEQISEQILGSIILFVWKTVRKVLFQHFYYEPNMANDLLQKVVMNIKRALKTFDATRPERFITYFGKNLEFFLIEELYKERSVVVIPRSANGRLPISIHVETENGTTLEDSLPDTKTISVEQQLNQDKIAIRLHEEIRIRIIPLLKTEAERHILQGLLGDFDKEDWNQLQEEHSITKLQLKTKQNKILRILKNSLDPLVFNP